MSTVIAVGLTVFFALPIIGLLLGYRPWDSTTPADASTDAEAAEYANLLLEHEPDSERDKRISAAAWGNWVGPERVLEPTPKPLSPWLDETP
jgi:hypothetical protein